MKNFVNRKICTGKLLRAVELISVQLSLEMKTSVRQGNLTDQPTEILLSLLAGFDGIFLFPQNDTDGRKSTDPVDFGI